MTSGLAEVRRLAETGVLDPPADPAAASEIVARAAEQGLVALLDAAVARSPLGFSTDVRGDLRDKHRACLFDGVQRQALARRASRRLRESGIRTLALKGVALLDFVYDSPAERPMADVDLFCLESFDAAVASLEQAGFLALDRAAHATALRERASGGVLELHRDLTSCRGFFPLDSPALWQRRCESDDLARPSAEDLLVQLAIHAAFQHGFAISLAQWLDFRRLQERAALDPTAVLERARESRAEGCLFAALALARHVVGGAAPEALAAALEKRAPGAVRRRVAQALGRDPLWLLSPPSALGLFRWRVALAAGRRASLLLKTLSPEGGAESLGARAARLTTRLLAAHPSRR